MVKLEMEQNFDSAGCTKVATCISAFSDVCSYGGLEEISLKALLHVATFLQPAESECCSISSYEKIT